MSCVWPELLPELAERIASFLATNDVACGLRLVNKAAAAQFRGPQHTTIQLSQPVLHDVFVAKWAAPGAMRSFPLRRRRQLLCLTAASGSIPNLEVAVSAASCRLTHEVMAAAAAAGKLDVCQWLHQHGCTWWGTLQHAALNGLKHVCTGLLEKGCPWCWGSVAQAARGGRVDLADWLLQQEPQPARGDSDLIYVDAAKVHGRLSALIAVAEGCDLPTLQRLFPKLTPVPGSLVPAWKGDVLAGAARSSTPDWAAKVEWLEGQGCPRSAAVTKAAAARPHSDAADRLAWLLERGYPVDATAGPAAAATGNVAVLERLRAEGVDFDNRVHDGSAIGTMAQASATGAARAGHLAFLQALHRMHRNVGARGPAGAAARKAHLHVVAWLLDEAGEGDAGWDTRQLLGPQLLKAAAESGSVELMAWLRERGCGWDAGAFTAAAVGGSEEALEWLAERGCPMEQDDGAPYVAACDNGDLATLRCLRRLGFPWGPADRVLSRADHVGWLPVLRWLREEGFPAPPNLLAALARDVRARGQAEVANLLEGWQHAYA